LLTKTLEETFATVVDWADVGGQTDDTTGRHPKAAVCRYINDSYRSIRSWSVTVGFRDFITPGGIALLPAEPEPSETYGVIELPASALSLQGVDVLVNDRWHSLEQVDWESRRSLQPRGGNCYRPLWFAVRNRALVSGSSVEPGSIALFPFSANGSYRLFTLEEWTDITADEDLLVFPSQAWFDAVTYEVALKLVALKDGDNTRRGSWLQTKLDEAKTTILATVPKLTQAGPRTMRRDHNYRSGW
jgi:hypothetical protein